VAPQKYGMAAVENHCFRIQDEEQIEGSENRLLR
jgi:hypothetical protein